MNQPFGHYQLLDRVGSGSLGEVFRALDAQGRSWALKRLVAERVSDEALRAVFLQELALAQQLGNAPGLVAAVDSGDHQGWPFYTMRLYEKGCLADRLEEGPLPRELLEAVLSDLGRSLDALAQAGYLHCDLSPKNFLWEDDGLVLADLGSATPIGASQPSPRGTYGYMSPEQVRHEALDERSQLFSAAALLWHCATGQAPFARPDQHLVFMAVVGDEPAEWLGGPAAWEAPLRQALQKEAAERGPGLSDLLRALQDAL
jgi:serine/threonine protein kinase